LRACCRDGGVADILLVSDADCDKLAVSDGVCDIDGLSEATWLRDCDAVEDSDGVEEVLGDWEGVDDMDRD